jgi:hypothetical protein
MHCDSPSLPPRWNVPDSIGAALDRASRAELQLNRVFPLFATKLDDVVTPGALAQASLELDAFAAQLKVTHRAALQSLVFYRQRRTSPESVAAAYEALAVLIETFARGASLDASELEEG